MYVEHLKDSLVAPSFVGILSSLAWFLTDAAPLEGHQAGETYFEGLERGQAAAGIGLFYSIFLIVWIAINLEMWKRKQAHCALEWGTVGVIPKNETRA